VLRGIPPAVTLQERKKNRKKRKKEEEKKRGDHEDVSPAARLTGTQ
jgi:hypothetical protein